MKKSLILLVLLAGCGGAAEQPGGNASEPGTGAEAQERGATDAAAQAIETTRLTGLYEGGPPGQPSQLCIVDRGTGDAQFGIVVWGANMHSCSGAGQAVREGDALRLRMAGDSACEIRASIRDGTVTLPQSPPSGCTYYCGARAQFAGATLARTGTSVQDAMKAKDLAGDPLCAGISSEGR